MFVPQDGVLEVDISCVLVDCYSRRGCMSTIDGQSRPSWAQYIEQFRIVPYVFTVSAPTIQRDYPSMMRIQESRKKYCD